MSPYIATGAVHGVHYRVHWTVLLLFPVCWAFAGSVVSGAVASVSLFGLLVAHEVGHAFLASFCGLRVIRLDLNAVHGRCWFDAPEFEIEMALISWGGVLAQAVLLVAFCFIYALVLYLPQPLHDILAPVVVVFTFLNTYYIIQNLWPKAPLDGAFAWKLVPYLMNGDLRRYLRARAETRTLFRSRVR